MDLSVSRTLIGSLVTLEPVTPPVDAAETEQRLRLAFPKTEIMSLGGGWTACHVRVGAETVQDLKIQYWVTNPDVEQLRHSSVDAPIASDAELDNALFDAIVDSVRWTTRAAERSPVGAVWDVTEKVAS